MSATIPDAAATLARRHLRVGWWTLLVFIVLGSVLEAMHGFKVDAYLNVLNETRRLMWTLSHAHGTLLGLLNIALAVSLPVLPAWSPAARSFASRCLLGATALMPVGFFAGGTVLYAGDPGLGILLVPLGALLLIVAVTLTALATKRAA